MNEEQLNALWATLSRPRMAQYLEATGEDRERALQLYVWNARIGAEFHFCIQTCEVALRNRIGAILRAEFGDTWFREAAYLALIDDGRQADLDQAATRIRNRKQALTNDQVVATLSFGFWVGMLEPRYNPAIWAAHLRAAFPGLPDGRARTSVHQSAVSALTLRNRIFHHEPLISLDLSKTHSDISNLLS